MERIREPLILEFYDSNLNRMWFYINCIINLLSEYKSASFCFQMIFVFRLKISLLPVCTWICSLPSTGSGVLGCICSFASFLASALFRASLCLWISRGLGWVLWAGMKKKKPHKADYTLYLDMTLISLHRKAKVVVWF